MEILIYAIMLIASVYSIGAMAHGIIEGIDKRYILAFAVVGFVMGVLSIYLMGAGL